MSIKLIKTVKVVEKIIVEFLKKIKKFSVIELSIYQTISYNKIIYLSLMIEEKCINFLIFLSLYNNSLMN